MTPVLTRPNTQRFVGNTSTMEVHDLRNEKATCEVDACIRAGTAVIFSPDTLFQAQSEGYRNGYWCLGHAQR